MLGGKKWESSLSFRHKFQITNTHNFHYNATTYAFVEKYDS